MAGANFCPLHTSSCVYAMWWWNLKSQMDPGNQILICGLLFPLANRAASMERTHTHGIFKVPWNTSEAYNLRLGGFPQDSFMCFVNLSPHHCTLGLYGVKEHVCLPALHANLKSKKKEDALAIHVSTSQHFAYCVHLPGDKKNESLVLLIKHSG